MVLVLLFVCVRKLLDEMHDDVGLDNYLGVVMGSCNIVEHLAIDNLI